MINAFIFPLDGVDRVYHYQGRLLETIPGISRLIAASDHMNSAELI